MSLVFGLEGLPFRRNEPPEVEAYRRGGGGTSNQQNTAKQLTSSVPGLHTICKEYLGSQRRS